MVDVGSRNSIIDLGHYTRSENIGLDMPPSHLGKHTTDDIDLECHHPIWTTQIVRRRWAWISIIALGRHTKSKDVRRGMPSLPLDSRYSRTTSDVACHHCPWLAHTIGSRRALDAIITLVQQTRSNYVGRGMPLSIMVFSSY